MKSSDSNDAKLGPILDDFMLRAQKGEKPTIEEYADRYPEMEQLIREVLPTLLMMEKLGQADQPSSDAKLQPAPAETAMPERLGEYRIVREIGRGGMGIVYEALQESLGRRVALKVLPQVNFFEQDRIERFRQEAKSAGKLHHTNIVPVFAVGQYDEVYYYAMQYIEGSSLDAVIKQLALFPNREASPRTEAATQLDQTLHLSSTIAQSLYLEPVADSEDSTAPNSPRDSAEDSNRTVVAPTAADPKPSTGQLPKTRSATLPTEKIAMKSTGRIGDSSSGSGDHYARHVARIGLQAAEAIAYAHRRGILHRDIKPANLMLDEKQNVWITDFGLAKAGDVNLTRTGELVGTLRYMAPERLSGIDDERGDVFGLGTTLYELATLRPAFQADDRAALMSKLMNEDPPHPRSINEKIPRNLETIIEKSLARDPLARYQTAQDLADDLQRYLDNRPVLAQKSNWVARLTLWSRRNPVPAGLISLITLLLIGIAVASTWTAIQLNKNNADILAGLNREKSERQKSNQALYENYLNQAESSKFNTKSGRRKLGLDFLRMATDLRAQLNMPPDDEARRRQIAVDLALLFDCKQECVKKLRLDSPAVEFDMDRELIYWNDNKGDIVVSSIRDGKEIQRIKGAPYHCLSICLSPDRQFLATRVLLLPKNEYVVRLIEIETGQIIHEGTAQVAEQRQHISFSGNGKKFGYVDENNCVIVYDINAKRIQLKTDPQEKKVSWIALDRFGNQIVIDQNPHAALINVLNGNLSDRMIQFEVIESVTWDPRGARFAAAGNSGNVYIWDTINTNAPEKVLAGHSAPISKIEYHPQGHMLMSSSMDATTRFWDSDSGQLLLEAGSGGSRFSGNGNLVGFYYFGEYGIWSLENLKTRFTHGHRRDDFVTDVDFSADQRYLIWTSLARGVSLWDFSAGSSARIHNEYSYNNNVQFLSQPDSNEQPHAVIASGSGKACRFQVNVAEYFDGPQHSADGLLSIHDGNEFHSFFTVANDGRVVISEQKEQLNVFGLESGLNRFTTPLKCGRLASHPSQPLVVATNTESKQVMVFDILSGNTVEILDTRSNSTFPCFNHQGTQLVLASSSGVSIYDVDSWTEIFTIPKTHTKLGSVTFSPDDQLLVIADYDRVHFYDTTTMTKVYELAYDTTRFGADLYEQCPGIGFSHDGQFLAVGTSSNSVAVFDIERLTDILRELKLSYPYPER